MKSDFVCWALLGFVGVLLAGCGIPPLSAEPPVQSPSPVVTSSAVPAVGSPSPIATPSVGPYPPPELPPFVQPSRRPPITYVIPTPPTPVSTTARITRDQAINSATQANAAAATLSARGQLTVTATSMTWGDYSGNSQSPIAHPTLPVWVVKLEMPPWTEMTGPVGKQIQVTYHGYGYVIDGITGKILVSFRISN